MEVVCPGGISYTRADYTEEGSGGTFETADDYSKAMSGLTMYPEVTPFSPFCLLPMGCRETAPKCDTNQSSFPLSEHTLHLVTAV